MSLTHFIQRPAIRDSFKAYSAKPALPPDLKHAAPIVPSHDTRTASFIGTAFDYMARFRIARDLIRDYPTSDFELHDAGWVAEHAVDILAELPEYRPAHVRWSSIVGGARDLFVDFIEGQSHSLNAVADACQYLAKADMVVRAGSLFTDFTPYHSARRELLALNSAFEPSRLFRPERSVLLNPHFAASGLVDGADADLIVDGLLVDIKTTIELRLDMSHLRQLAGYAVLHSMGGAVQSDGTLHEEPITEVALYFSRHGLLLKWRLDELLPGDGFSQFADAFEREIAVFAAEHD